MTDRAKILRDFQVRACLDGRMTQFREVITRLPRFGKIRKFQRSDTPGYDWTFRDKEARWHDLRDAELRKALPYAPGDRLWVRETWGVIQAFDHLSPREIGTRYFYDGRYQGSIGYTTDGPDRWCQTGCNGAAGKWRPSIHMPRWASRLTLIVEAVRVQRLQEISEEDAIAEGIEYFFAGLFRDYLQGPDIGIEGAVPSFHSLWDSLNAKRGFGWEANPWVCAVTFRVVQANIDSLPRAA